MSLCVLIDVESTVDFLGGSARPVIYNQFHSPAGHPSARVHDDPLAGGVGPAALAQRPVEVPPARLRLQLCNVAGGHRDHPALPHLHQLHGPGGE